MGGGRVIPRTKHTLFRAAGNRFHENLDKACRSAENDGMVLIAVVRASEWTYVAVFVGVESAIGELSGG